MRPYYDEGGITIYHGDALDVLPEMPAESVDAIVTDPPYKLSQEYSASTDADNLLAVASVWPMFSASLRVVRPGGIAAVFYDTRILPLALTALRGGGWRYLRALTLYRRWGQASLLHGWMSTSDFVLIGAKPGARPSYHGSARHDVYVRDKPECEFFNHPAQKPMDCVAHIVERVAPKGGVILDPYVGSGTSLVAARDLGRRAIGIEIEERYCEIAAKRLAQEVLTMPEPAATEPKPALTLCGD